MARKIIKTKSLMLRLPEAIRAQMEHEAERHGRSMNAEIVYRLEMSLKEMEAQQEQLARTHQQMEFLHHFIQSLQENIFRTDERQKVIWEDMKKKLSEILDVLKPDQSEQKAPNKSRE